LGNVKKWGGRRIPVWEKFEMAGLSDEHSVIYAILCSHSHHGISELERRHIEVEKEGGVILKLMELPTLNQLNHILDLVAQILVRSLSNLTDLAVVGEIDQTRVDAELGSFLEILE